MSSTHLRLGAVCHKPSLACIDHDTADQGRRVAFGSNVERLMFPMHTAPTRLGIEQGMRGEPHRGPGCYTEDIVS